MHWKSIEHVAKVTVPLLLIVGLEDELVPPHHTKELHAAAVNSPLTYIRELPRGTHNDTWAKGGVDYVKWLEVRAPGGGGRGAGESRRLARNARPGG